MSTENWILESDLCRCCHSEGKYKNLAEPWYNLGQQEIYADMIRDCFNVDMEPVPGMLCAVTYTICDACVARVRDAFNFRKQVKSCEERFRDMYNKNIIKVGGSNLQVKVKEEILDSTTVRGDCKIELPADEDEIQEDFDETFALKCNDDEDSDDTLDVIKKKPKKENAPKTKRPAKKTVKQKVIKEEVAETGGEEPAKNKGNRRRATYYTIFHNEYKCNLCDRSFASQALVSQHYRFVHLKRRPRERKCPKCDEKIPAYLRAYHLEKEHDVPAPSCGVCGKKFRYQCHVLQHQKKVHMGEKNVVCAVCDKSFFSNISLRLHMLTHSNERKFKCGVCEKQFRWENNLKDHVKIHTGERRFVCRVCDKMFVQKSTLKQHGVRHHPGVEILK